MRRPFAAAIVVALGTGLLAASCGGSSDGVAAGETTSASTTSASEPTIEELYRAPGEDVAAVPGTSDNAVGSNRISFLIVDKQSKLIERPTARVWVAKGLKQAPFAETTARLEPIGVPGGESAGADGIYVATVRAPTTGTYWYLAEPVGGPRIQALGNLVVRTQTAAPTLGDPAIASRTPTLASTGGDLSALTTSRSPDRALYSTSVAQALAAHEPFVVAFATPQYCQSRTCGPVVDVVSSVRKQPDSAGVRFIHVEIYKDNDPANGVNQWVSQWRLPTEPFTFVVDRKGVIRARLEGAFSAGELERAVAKVR